MNNINQSEGFSTQRKYIFQHRKRDVFILDFMQELNLFSATNCAATIGDSMDTILHYCINVGILGHFNVPTFSKILLKIDIVQMGKLRLFLFYMIRLRDVVTN